MKGLAIIPARGGSKRIPEKNIKEFEGAPIISYVMNAIRQTDRFESLHVSTDSKKIAGVCDQLGCAVDFLRPKALSADLTPIIDVIRFVVEQLEQRDRHYDFIGIFTPCSPLLTSQDISGALDLFFELRCENPVIAVTKYPAPIEWSYRAEEKTKRLKPVAPMAINFPSQSLEPSYYDCGSMVLMARDTVYNPNFAEEFVGYVLPPWRAVDIDDMLDWELAKLLYRGSNQISARNS